jgi:hypothetical protein
VRRACAVYRLYALHGTCLCKVLPVVLRCGVGGNCLGPSLTNFPRIGWFPLGSVQGLTAACVGKVSKAHESALFLLRYVLYPRSSPSPC